MLTKTLHILLLICLPLSQGFAFCGFYVASADHKLFNKSSEVIIVRDGDKNTVTMSNDFQGEVEDFAMIIPVPEVLKRKQITIADQHLLDVLGQYSAPRTVKYDDPIPCKGYLSTQSVWRARSMKTLSGIKFKKNSVRIKARYQVEEYEIMILSAKHSEGLESWLKHNGYQLPENAGEVLRPYIKSGMKFIVVKVDAEKYASKQYQKLRPLQITYDSKNFMLPIRLGMANASDVQDLLIHAITKNGRVETVNYPTVKVPTEVEVPLFVQKVFGKFYKDLFIQNWEKSGKNKVFLEYAWNLSGFVTTKCDPCNGPPPYVTQLIQAGATWLKPLPNGYEGNLFYTRLHVRYDREHFPQDLVFQETPDKTRFQARYITRVPADPPYPCEGTNVYLLKLKYRRQNEMKTLANLTNWDLSDQAAYPDEYDCYAKGENWIQLQEKLDKQENNLPFFFSPGNPNSGNPAQEPAPRFPYIMLTVVLLALAFSLRRRYLSRPTPFS